MVFDLTPFRRFGEDLFDEINKSLSEMFDSGRFPAPSSFGNKFINTFRTDIIEKENEYYVEAELPGFTKNDIQIEFEDNRLTIRAKRDALAEEKDELNQFIRRERRYGEFVRQFYVDNVNEDGISAKLENGILKLHLPKKVPGKPKRRTIDIE